MGNSKKTFWTVEIDDEVFDADFDTKIQAQTWADKEFQGMCEDEVAGKDDVLSHEIRLIRFYYDDETGERRIVESETSSVEFEFFPDDRDEHGTLHNGGGGVL